MDLSKRARSILYAVITEFIASGEPVGSRTLSKKYGFDLSPASIRNVLADLEDAGLLVQPHTSAGRVPTPAAFRLFIDALLSARELPVGSAQQIQSQLEALPPGADMLREVGRLLSDMSGVAAITFRSRTDQRTVVKLRFIPTRPGELLSVIVLSDGTVENRFIRMERPPSEGELERVHNLLEEMVGGLSLASLRDYVANGAAAQRGELAKLQGLGVSLINAALEGSSPTQDIIIEGRARLLEQPEFAHTTQVKEVMRALEEREQLVNLLDRTLASEQVQVFLGEEATAAVGYPVSLVAAPYREQGGEPGGAVGVIGPTRMDYPFLVPLVAATARAMSAAIAGRTDTAPSPKPDRDES
jgi:heat-inducible transcriptional repressor